MRTGFTCGSFDLLHAGHVRMLKEAKTVCDVLIVGLHIDPSIDRPEKNKPVQTLTERWEVLEAIRYVDEVLVYETEAELVEILKSEKLGIDICIIGADWQGRPFTGQALPIPIHFNTRDHEYSSSSLRKRIIEAESTGCPQP